MCASISERAANITIISFPAKIKEDIRRDVLF